MKYIKLTLFSVAIFGMVIGAAAFVFPLIAGMLWGAFGVKLLATPEHGFVLWFCGMFFTAASFALAALFARIP